MRWLRTVAVIILAVSATGGCGFIAAGKRSPTKPDGFVLHGYVSVAGVLAGNPGAPCQAPRSVPDIVSGGPVRVADTTGAIIANGILGAGVEADGPAASGPAASGPAGSGYRCNFPFEIRNVPGEEQEYVIVVGTRPAASFDGTDLRANQPAVINLQ